MTKSVASSGGSSFARNSSCLARVARWNFCAEISASNSSTCANHLFHTTKRCASTFPMGTLPLAFVPRLTGRDTDTGPRFPSSHRSRWLLGRPEQTHPQPKDSPQLLVSYQIPYNLPRVMCICFSYPTPPDTVIMDEWWLEHWPKSWPFCCSFVFWMLE